MSITIDEGYTRNSGQVKVWLKWSHTSRGITPTDVITKTFAMQVNPRLNRERKTI